MGAQSGTYTPKNSIDVVVWPAPDADGDSDTVYNDDGTAQLDGQGREVKRYKPPEGFSSRPSRNENGVQTDDNWVKLTDRGEIVRDVNGNAVHIHEGAAGLTHPDGTYELLEGAALRAFLNSHELQGGTGKQTTTEGDQS